MISKISYCCLRLRSSWCLKGFISGNKNLIIRDIKTIFKTRDNFIATSKQHNSLRLSLKLATGFSLATIVTKSYNFNFQRVECEPNINVERPQEHNNYNWRQLLSLMCLDIWQWIGAIVAALGVAYINIQIPLCLGDLVNLISAITNGTDSSVFQDVNISAIKMISLYIAQALGTLIYIGLLSSAGENLARRLKSALYESLLQQDMAFFDNKRTGELLDCMFMDVQEFKSSFKQCVSQGLKNILQICGCVFSLFYISPAMTCSVLTVVPAIIITGSLFGIFLRKISNAAQIKSVKAFTMCEEVLSNIRTVRSFSNENLECKKLNSELNDSCRLNIWLGYGIGVFQAGTNLFLNGLVLGTLYIGSHYILSDQLSPGSLMSFLVTAQIIQKSFGQLSLTFGHFIKGKQAFERVCHYLRLKPAMPISGGIMIPYHSLKPQIEFKDVIFSYPTRPTQVVLNNLNLSLPAGQTVAVVGSSGNGKSTIALLLERFYDVNSGMITLSGVDIKKLDPRWLRSSVIGIISQEPILFATSIKENIRYGKPNATDEEIYEAAKLANADGFINEFPNGYETVVGERGIAMSGGQKQRIAIARALIKKPAVLILDEATSALDSESERVVQNTLEQVCKGRTVLVIAHRLSTVQNAQVIAVLNKGIILELGSHEELMKRKGAYYGLMNQQKKGWSSRFIG